MQFRISPKTLSECSAEEWQARVDLAAAHRLAYMHDFSEGIFNHLTLVVPGRTDRYYQIPFGTHWSEGTASCFMEVGIDDGLVKSGAGDVERSCYCIHAPMHRDSYGRDLCTISFGGTRKFVLKNDATGKTQSWNLADGDVHYFPLEVNLTSKHGVPKCANADPRISLLCFLQ